MKRIFAILSTLAAAPGAVLAAPFAEPQAHPVSRYEAGWQKNPFTLKTAPVAVQKDSFAKDLALAGWRQAGEDSIVILVNTKTREYFRLKNQEPGADGTKVKTAHLEDRHAATFVELERDNETAVVRYDESFLRQMAAQGAASKPASQVAMRTPNTTGQGPPAGMGMNPNAATTPQPVMAPNITPSGSPPGMMTPLTNPQGQQPGAPMKNNIPTVERRRLNNLPQPIPR